MADVLERGHADKLFDVDYMEGSPQVHLHFLTDEDEYVRLGYGKMELCCHGCGQSVLVLYDKSKSKRQHLALRNNFKKRHSGCPNKQYDSKCPNYRSSIEVLDVRSTMRRYCGTYEHTI